MRQTNEDGSVQNSKVVKRIIETTLLAIMTGHAAALVVTYYVRQDVLLLITAVLQMCLVLAFIEVKTAGGITSLTGAVLCHTFGHRYRYNILTDVSCGDFESGHCRRCGAGTISRRCLLVKNCKEWIDERYS